MKKLSIIIPVYNVDKYINKCVDSILHANIENYEIILVDDGSTDNSGKICDEYSDKYNEISVFHKKNGGASSARNCGINHSSGEYLMFIDSDDFISNKINFLSIKLNDDIVQYKMMYYYEKLNKYIYLRNYNVKCENYLDILNELVKSEDLSISPCNKFVKRSIVIENKIFFDEKILLEDIDWSLKLYSHCNSIKLINEDIYVYRQQREGSVTTNLSKNNIDSLFYIIKFWSEKEYNNLKLKNIYLNYLAYQYTILLALINKQNCSRKKYKEILTYKYVLENSESHKVKMCNIIFKIFGISLGRYILKSYVFLKNKGIIKL